MSLNCSNVSRFRRASLTRRRIVPKIAFFSVMFISVNITPTTWPLLYHPAMSVSLVEQVSAVRNLSSFFPLLSEAKSPPVFKSIRRNGLRDRSVLFRSSEIVRRKVSSSRMPRWLDTGLMRVSGAFIPVLDAVASRLLAVSLRNSRCSGRLGGDGRS